MIDRIVLYPVGDDPPQARLMYGQDCLISLRTLPDQSVHMVATSPPYYGLRDYQTGTWEGGSDPSCDHDVRHWDGPKQTQGAQSGHASKADNLRGQSCTRCGARRRDDQIGLEGTPEQYIARLVEVFREVRRVLRDDGVAWLNLGDSYVTSMKGIGGDTGFSAGGDKRQNNRTQPKMDVPIKSNYGSLPVKPKDILGIPWRVAFALQADGWGLRQDMIWSKNNPMPESVVDRCTKAHEYIFLLTKQERYFYDADAVREPLVSDYSRDALEKGKSQAGVLFRPEGDNFNKQARHESGDSTPRTRAERAAFLNPAGRNRRSVWTINPQPYPGAHFATWPEALVEIMVKAGSSEQGCCPQCQAPFSRMVTKRPRGWDGSKYGENVQAATGGVQRGGTKKSTLGSDHGRLVNATVTEGWHPTCTCDAEGAPLRCTVLDLFSGSATTGAVAMRLRRDYIGLDLNESYLGLAEARLEGRVAPSTAPEDEDINAGLFWDTDP